MNTYIPGQKVQVNIDPEVAESMELSLSSFTATYLDYGNDYDPSAPHKVTVPENFYQDWSFVYLMDDEVSAA